MRGTKAWKAVVGALCLTCCGSAMAQPAIGNGSFENPLQFDVQPVVGEWTGFFGGPPTSTLAAAQNTTAPRTGANALFLSVTGDGNAFAGMQQPITGLQANVSYQFSIWARRAGNVTNGVEYRIEWKNAAGGIIGDQFALTTRIDSALTDTYQQFTLTAVSPPGTASGTLVLAVQSFVFDPLNPQFDTNVYIDDASFSASALPGQGACCLPDGSCTVAAIGACPIGATQQAGGTTCLPNNCPAPNIGACCNTTTGACVVLAQADCAALSTGYQGAGTSCTPNPCVPTPDCPADFNNQSGVTVQDIFDFLSAWFTGCP